MSLRTNFQSNRSLISFLIGLQFNASSNWMHPRRSLWKHSGLHETLLDDRVILFSLISRNHFAMELFSGRRLTSREFCHQCDQMGDLLDFGLLFKAYGNFFLVTLVVTLVLNIFWVCHKNILTFGPIRAPRQNSNEYYCHDHHVALHKLRAEAGR